MIAIGVFAVVATFMAQTLGSALAGVLGGKRREVAIQEGNRTLEIARSLTWDAIGLASSDTTIATDTAITLQGGELSYRASTWEPLVYATNPTAHPFNPHIKSLARGGTDLVRYVYITGVDSDTDGTYDLKRVSVRVTWTNSGSGGPQNEIRAQTLISKSGLVPTGTGADTTPLTGNAFVSGGGLSVTSSLLGLTAPLDLSLPTSTGNTTFRAVSTSNCAARSTALSALNLVDLPGDAVTVAADDDNRTATSSNPGTQQKIGVLGIPAGPIATLLGSVINSPISCAADVSGYGHETGTGSAAGTVTASAPGLGGLLNWLLTLASVQTLPVSQQIDHQIVAGQREAYAQASASVGAINILKLPLGGIPDGLVKIDGLSYDASVRGAKGTPSAEPIVNPSSFTLRIFDKDSALIGDNSTLKAACTTGITLGLGVSVVRSNDYCVFTIDPKAAGFNGLTLPVISNTFSLLGVSLGYSTSFSILPPAKSPWAGVVGPNLEKTWVAQYSPLSLNASLDASILGVPFIDADVDLSLGTVKAEACAGVTCK